MSGEARYWRTTSDRNFTAIVVRMADGRFRWGGRILQSWELNSERVNLKQGDGGKAVAYMEEMLGIRSVTEGNGGDNGNGHH